MRNTAVNSACEQCGRVFKTWPSRLALGFGRFCSRACKGVWQSRPIEERFWEKVARSEGCWRWTGYKLPKGYGMLGKELAHRVSWRLANGWPAPSNLEVCHHCDNRSCVRPDHLFLGTRLDNAQDAKQKERTLAGESNPQAKLTAAQVIEIRRRKRAGEHWRALASEYGVSATYIFDVVSGKRWGPVRDEIDS